MKEKKGYETTPPGERCLLVCVMNHADEEWRIKDSLSELARLVDTLGGTVVDQLILKQKSIHPGHYIGKGTAEHLAETVREKQCDAVVFNDEISPAQGRNLELMLQVCVIDRTQVILDIFARHAKSREGILQVELALLNYQLPRLRRLWTHLERQTGGIGVRGGPGEQQIEVDRRRIREKIAKIQDELKDVQRHRNELRRGRRRHGWASISLVGYTNAGKSTLLNCLTDASVEAKDALFVTLDTTTRKVELPNRQPALLNDTVGFINKLPHHLIEAFHATLEEVTQADVLIHVVDASSEQVEEQISAVNQVLDELGIGDRTVIMALNKIDLSSGRQNAGRLARLNRLSVPISATTGEGVGELLNMLSEQLKSSFQEVYLSIPFSDAKMQASVHHDGVILEKSAGETALAVYARMPTQVLHRYAQYLINEQQYRQCAASAVDTAQS